MSAWADQARTARVAKTSVIHEVHVDGLSVLKIAKHSKDALPALVSGPLLGLDQKGILEVTHSFPRGYGDEAPNDEYQMAMLKSLREVNVDNNVVGWYQSMILGTFSTAELIDNLISYHQHLPNSIVIVHDPVQTANGKLTLRAFRLSNEFLEIIKREGNDFIRPKNILEELPVKIRNPGLVNALLYDFQSNKMLNCDFERLDLSTNPYLEKNLEQLCSWVDDLAGEQQIFQQEIRREKWKRSNGDAAEDSQTPERLPSLLVSNQIHEYCEQVQQFTGTSFGKLFLAASLHKDV